MHLSLGENKHNVSYSGDSSGNMNLIKKRILLYLATFCQAPRVAMQKSFYP
jgi:hypothetical protein